MSEKKPSCPNCNSENVAWFFYGYPGDMDWYLEAVKKKEIIGGGCVIGNNDPKWKCNDCYHRWGDADHNFED